jgi:hypothetical protein
LFLVEVAMCREPFARLIVLLELVLGRPAAGVHQRTPHEPPPAT